MWGTVEQPHALSCWGMRVAEGGLFPPGSNTWVVGWCFPAALCLQPMDEGSCRHYVLLWYYHPEANACRPFIFGGCRGNSNRFESKWRCEQQCRTSAGKAAPEPSKPPLPPTRKTHPLPTSVTLWCPTSTKQELGGTPLVCKVSFPPTPSSLLSPPPSTSQEPLDIPSLSPGPLGMQVDLRVMRRVPMVTSTGF